MSKPSDGFEMMVWERLFAACLTAQTRFNATEAADCADEAFVQYKKRSEEMGKK